MTDNQRTETKVAYSSSREICMSNNRDSKACNTVTVTVQSGSGSHIAEAMHVITNNAAASRYNLGLLT